MRALAQSTLLLGLLLTTGAALAADAGAGLKPGATFRDCPTCPEMVIVPAGSFLMGSTEEEQERQGVDPIFGQRETPVTKITIAKPFAIAVTETTRGQYARFARVTKRAENMDCGFYDPKKDSFSLKGHSWAKPGFPQTDDHPVVCMSWNDANDYAAWLAKSTGQKYRLPSEAEWEYAARGGTTTVRYWGDNDARICNYAHILTSATYVAIGNSPGRENQLVCASTNAWTVPAGSFDPNPFGVKDTLGSVWEYMLDCATPNHQGRPADGSAIIKPNCSGRLTKGGAFHSQVWLVRPSTRGAGLPSDIHPIASGFRVMRELR